MISATREACSPESAGSESPVPLAYVPRPTPPASAGPRAARKPPKSAADRFWADQVDAPAAPQQLPPQEEDGEGRKLLPRPTGEPAGLALGAPMRVKIGATSTAATREEDADAGLALADALLAAAAARQAETPQHPPPPPQDMRPAAASAGRAAAVRTGGGEHRSSAALLQMWAEERERAGRGVRA